MSAREHEAQRTIDDIQRFRRGLRSGRVLLGAAITFSDVLVTDCLADSVDFFWIDMEHSGMTTETVAGHLLAARARKVPALVRVVGSGWRFIKPVLDAGAQGIIVPQVRSAEEVRGVVADCRYPPLGERGFGPRVPSDYGRDQGQSFMTRANREVYVSVQIENAEALADIDEIVAVPGLDGVVLGPGDLSGSLGVPGKTNHRRVVAAMETVIKKGRAAGLSVGAGVGPDPQAASVMAKRGVHWMHVGADSHYLWRHFDQMAAAARRKLGTRPRHLAAARGNN